MIPLTIDGRSVSAEEGMTILEAATSADIRIPTLCHLKEINEAGVCRVCVVEIEGSPILQAACTTPVTENMIIHTASREVIDSRRSTMELLLSNHSFLCPSCTRDENCGIQNLARELDISMYYGVYKNEGFPYQGEQVQPSCLHFSSQLTYDNSRCVLCRKCVAVCDKIQDVAALAMVNTGFETRIGTENGRFQCVDCGQCILACPTGALSEPDQIPHLQRSLGSSESKKVIGIDPISLSTICDDFGADFGGLNRGRLIATLKALGFDAVFSTESADQDAILNEGKDLKHHIQNKDIRTLFSSFCPSWTAWAGQMQEQLPHAVSHCRLPPVKMREKVDETFDNALNVTVSPCMAAKNDVRMPRSDTAMTTRELYYLLKQASVDFINIAEQDFDSFPGEVEKKVTPSVGERIEAVLRAAFDPENDTPYPLSFQEVKDLPGVKETRVEIDGQMIRAASVKGLANAGRLLDRIKQEGDSYNYIEVMACPGGCLRGGGQICHIEEELFATTHDREGQP